MKKVAKLFKPIFLLGAHKSGTSLLRSLLDGHPSLCVLPKECHFFQNSGYFVEYPLRYSSPRKMNFKDLSKSYVNYIKQQNDNSDVFADSFGVSCWDENQFVKYFSTCDISTPSSLMAAYLASLFYSMTGHELPSNLRVVEKSVENAEYAFAIKSMCSDAKFIHIVRNPYANMVSLRKMKCSEKYMRICKLIGSLKNSWYYLFKNMSTIEDYMIVRYEDLIRNTEKILDNILNFLEIDYVPEMMIPTIQGSEWLGNSTSREKYSEISKAPLYAWKKSINDFEIHMANKVGDNVFTYFNYKKIVPSHHYLWPVKGENLKIYLSNRYCYEFI
jgi:hypothetical protein